MVSWKLVAGVVACKLFPHHRGIIILIGGISTLLVGNGKKCELELDEVNGLEATKTVKIEWNDVNCFYVDKNGKKVKQLLNGVNGVAFPGRLLAIMGPSGSGKTTLLSTLAGQLPRDKKLRLSGQLLVNGVSKCEAHLRQAFVRQEDIFFSQLTVRETLLMAAKLQLPSDLSDSQKEDHVDRLIQSLGLVSCAHTIVGDAKVRGISGGEKKRLSIACELMASPSVIFADEPTTGLDAFQAERVMGALRDLARQGHTVICSIHQPRGSIYDMFDDLLLLAEGKAVYWGAAGNDAINYFAQHGFQCPVHVNPAEYFSDLISIDFSSPETEAATRSRLNSLTEWYVVQASAVGFALPAGSTLPSAITSQFGDIQLAGKRVGWLTQFKVLFKRAWRQTTRDKATNLVRGAMNVTSALIFGSIFWRMGLGQTSIQDRMGLLQVAAINTAMASLTKTVNVFPRERVIVNREQSKGNYGTVPYFLSKLVAELPIGALFPVLFGAIVYPMAGLNRSLARFAGFLGVVTVESFTSGAMGLTVGSLAPSTEAALALGPSIMTVFIVFGGYYVNADNTPLIFRWIPNVSLIRWAFQGLCLNEFRGLKFRGAGVADLKTGEQVLERLSFGHSSLKTAIVKEAQILVFLYWSTLYLLMKRQPKFQVMLPSEQKEAAEAIAPLQATT